MDFNNDPALYFIAAKNDVKYYVYREHYCISLGFYPFPRILTACGKSVLQLEAETARVFKPTVRLLLLLYNTLYSTIIQHHSKTLFIILFYK